MRAGPLVRPEVLTLEAHPGVGASGSGAGTNVTGTGTPNVNHTPCGTTASQNNGTNSGANIFPNSTAQNQQPGQKSGRAPSPRSDCWFQHQKHGRTMSRRNIVRSEELFELSLLSGGWASRSREN